MTVNNLQLALGVTADGQWGPASRAALLAAFTNRAAAAVSAEDLAGFAARLGCTLQQLQRGGKG
jgi:peptidoglycan hydrolase-like protein with peptidoglycan-binding domain